MSHLYQMGDLSLRFETYAPLEWLERLPFRVFEATDELPTHLTVHFLLAGSPDPDCLPFTVDETQQLLKLGCSQDGLQNPLLQTDCVQSRLRPLMWQTDQVTLRVTLNAVILTDFVSQQLYIINAHDQAENAATTKIGPSLLRALLATVPAALIHCAAIEINGRAAVFLAPDSGGKTTLARQAPHTPEEKVISDDIVLVQKTHGEFMVYCTPWTRVGNPQKSAPLGGFFMLEQGAHFSLAPIDTRHVVNYLWSEHFSIFEYHFAEMERPRPVRYLTRPFSLRMFDFLSHISHHVPTHRMSFPKTGIDWDMIDQAMQP